MKDDVLDDENDTNIEESLDEVPDYAVAKMDELRTELGPKATYRIYREEPSGKGSFQFGGALSDLGTTLELQQKLQETCGAGTYDIYINGPSGRLKARYRLLIGRGPQKSETAPANAGSEFMMTIRPFLEEQSRITRELLMNRQPASPAIDPVQLMSAMAAMMGTMMQAVANMSRAPTAPSVDPLEQFEKIMLIADRLAERSLPPPERSGTDWIGDVLDKVAPAFGQLMELEREKVAVAKIGAEAQARATTRTDVYNPPSASPVIPPKIGGFGTITSQEISNMFANIKQAYRKEIDNFIQLGRLKHDPMEVAAIIDKAMGDIGIGDEDALTLLKRPDLFQIIAQVEPESVSIMPWLKEVHGHLISIIEGAEGTEDENRAEAKDSDGSE